MNNIEELNKPSAKFAEDALAPMHSTEHIVNQTMIRLFGCGRSVSAHIEKKKSKLDYILEKEPTEEMIAMLEVEVNKVIDSHLEVSEEFISREEAEGKYFLGKLPEDASETLRIVHIGDYDACPCIGKHVNNTREIDRFVILSHNWDEEKKRWRMRFRLEK